MNITAISLSDFVLGAATATVFAVLVAGRLLHRLRVNLAQVSEERRVLQERANRAAGLEQKLEQAIREQSSLRQTLAAESARFQEAERGFQEKVAILQQVETRFAQTFKALSSDALHESNRNFMLLAKSTFEGYRNSTAQALEARHQALDRTLENLMRPLKQNLEALEASRQGAYATLTEQIRHLSQGSNDLRTETARLVQALKTPSVRGRWGEIQLRRVVEFTGMLKYCDFLEQESVATEDGGFLRPDMVVKLPGRRQIVVDAKAPLQAFLEAVEASGGESDAYYAERMKAHAAQVRQHIEKLSRKEYWSQFAAAPEFVFAFLPGEAIFSAALQHDPSLIEFGADKRVILATPTTLITLLRVVAHGWREAQIAESAEQISVQGKVIYDRLVTFVGHFSTLRKSLDRAVESFNQSVVSLESRVLPAARKMKELGVASAGDLESIPTIERRSRVVDEGDCLQSLLVALPQDVSVGDASSVL